MCSNVDGPWKHAKWKKPVPEDHALYGPVYVTWQIDRDDEEWLPGAGESDC